MKRIVRSRQGEPSWTPSCCPSSKLTSKLPPPLPPSCYGSEPVRCDKHSQQQLAADASPAHEGGERGSSPSISYARLSSRLITYCVGNKPGREASMGYEGGLSTEPSEIRFSRGSTPAIVHARLSSRLPYPQYRGVRTIGATSRNGSCTSITVLTFI